MSKNLSKEVSRAMDGTPSGNFDEGVGQFTRRMGELGKHITQGVEAIETIRESIFGAIQGFGRLQGVEPNGEVSGAAARTGGSSHALASAEQDSTPGTPTAENIVSVPVDQSQLHWLDFLVEAKIMENRSMAAAYLLGHGIKARKEALERREEKFNRIRRQR